jgi:hypothetical protein
MMTEHYDNPMTFRLNDDPAMQEPKYLTGMVYVTVPVVVTVSVSEHHNLTDEADVKRWAVDVAHMKMLRLVNGIQGRFAEVLDETEVTFEEDQEP